MSRSFVYLMPSFSPSPIPVSPSESVTKYPPPLLLKAMLVLLKAMLVSLLLCLPHTLSYPYPLLLIELVHLLPCLFLPHVCSPVSSSICPPPYSLLYVHIMSLCHYVILSKLVIPSFCLKPFTPSKHVIPSLCLNTSFCLNTSLCHSV